MAAKNWAPTSARHIPTASKSGAELEFMPLPAVCDCKFLAVKPAPQRTSYIPKEVERFLRSPNPFHGIRSIGWSVGQRFCDHRYFDDDALLEHLLAQHQRCEICKQLGLYSVVCFRSICFCLFAVAIKLTGVSPFLFVLLSPRQVFCGLLTTRKSFAP